MLERKKQQRRKQKQRREKEIERKKKFGEKGRPADFLIPNGPFANDKFKKI